MYPLKLSTAITIPFFAHDVNGDGVTGIADGSWTKRISKGGGAFAAMTVTITELENGWYSLPVGTGHSDTLDILTMSFSAAACKRVNLQFRVSARIPDDLAYPTVSGRALDVSAGGEAGIDWANIGAPTTAQGLTGTTIATSQVVASVSGAVGSVTGAVGSVTGNVGGNVVGSVASVTGAVGSVTGAVGSVTGNVGGNVTGSVGSVLAGVSLAAAAIQAIWDALTANLTTVGSIGKLLVDNINATISSRLASASYTTPPTVLAIADQVWDEVLAGHLGAGSTGAALNAAGGAGDPWATALPGAYGAGTAGKIVGDNINATISSRSTVTTAQVNAEVVDVLTVDTFAEVVSAPAATSTLKDKIGWLFKLARNKRTTTATTDTLFNDAGAVADSTSTISDDGTTFTRGKYT